jgi:hypothetical protein
MDGSPERDLDCGVRPREHLALKLLVLAETDAFDKEIELTRARRVYHLATGTDALNHLIGVT